MAAAPADAWAAHIPSLGKDAAIIVDGVSGRALYARNADAPRYPASLTKMMTLYLLFEALHEGKISLDTPMAVSAHAAGQEPTKLNLDVGSTIPVELAIKAVAVLSANDVAVVIAEALGGTESDFAKLMTAKAHELGMAHTHFDNASGLPDAKQITTARDLALLGRHIAYDFPQYYRYFATKSFIYRNRRYTTHNHLIRDYYGTDGIKTGYTRASGFNLVTSVVRNDVHLVGVVMGGRTAVSRDYEMKHLLNRSFSEIDHGRKKVTEANVPWRDGPGPKINPFSSSGALVAALPSATPPRPTLKPDLRRLDGGVEVASGDDTFALDAGSAALPANTDGDPADEAVGSDIVLPVPKPGIQSASYQPDIPVGMNMETLPQGDISGPDLSSITAENPVDGSGLKQWTVQIGAFDSKTAARAKLAVYAERSKDVVGQARRIVVPYDAVGGHTLYRARFGLFAETEARQVCKRMTERGQTCFATVQTN